VQGQIEREEHERWGMAGPGVDPRIIEAEEAEYAQADCITVPSQFAYRSFLSQGVAPDKLRLLPYGVDLSRFEPAGVPPEGTFDVLFVGAMSPRKGVQYLVQAFQQIRHPAKTLSFVGAPSSEMVALLRQRNLWPEDALVLGPLPQQQLKAVMSRCHVMVLPSVEEGLALVQAQAMACACPVIGTWNSGAEDLFSDGQEGYIVPIRDVGAHWRNGYSSSPIILSKGERWGKEPWRECKASVAGIATAKRPCQFTAPWPGPVRRLSAKIAMRVGRGEGPPRSDATRRVRLSLLSR
jgi:alpha-maltose-1-phosphate synthase